MSTSGALPTDRLLCLCSLMKTRHTQPSRKRQRGTFDSSIGPLASSTE